MWVNGCKERELGEPLSADEFNLLSRIIIPVGSYPPLTLKLLHPTHSSNSLLEIAKQNAECEEAADRYKTYREVSLILLVDDILIDESNYE